MLTSHANLSLIWIVLPLFVGFSIYLLPKLDRALALLISLVSFGYGLWHVLNPEPLSLQLLDNFGVSLLIDGLSGFFILTNAVVTMAVILYCWHSDKGAFFYTQAIILHGSVNAVFVSADLISVYVFLDEEYHNYLWPFCQRFSNNHSPDFSDVEVLTVYFWGIKMGHKQLNYIHLFTKVMLREWFPNLPSYVSFVRRLNRMGSLFHMVPLA